MLPELRAPARNRLVFQMRKRPKPLVLLFLQPTNWNRIYREPFQFLASPGKPTTDAGFAKDSHFRVAHRTFVNRNSKLYPLGRLTCAAWQAIPIVQGRRSHDKTANGITRCFPFKTHSPTADEYCSYCGEIASLISRSFLFARNEGATR